MIDCEPLFPQTLSPYLTLIHHAQRVHAAANGSCLRWMHPINCRPSQRIIKAVLLKDLLGGEAASIDEA